MSLPSRSLLLAALVTLLATLSAAAEMAWVRDEVRLNLRTGPTVDNRIVATLKTGDSVEIVERAEKWTLVQLADGTRGWLPAGYLMAEPPARLRIIKLEQQLGGLREELEGRRQEVDALRGSAADVEAREAAQESRMNQLSRENVVLKAGPRWPYLIAGASILAAGMLLGALLASLSGRRQRNRIKFF